MSSISGMSALLTISAIAIVTMQLLKDNFNVVENYGEHDENGASLNPPSVPTNSERNHQDNLSPFKNGMMHTTPHISDDSSKYSGMSEAYSMYLQNLNASIPTQDALNSIGSQSDFLPGPNSFMSSDYASFDLNSKLSSCSQNMPTFGAGPSSVASSLLPKVANDELKGFADCDVNTLANQVFLTNRSGTNTVLGSLRNSNLSIRSEPANPVLNVGPWSNSTIYPDLLRRPLEECGPSFGLYGDGKNSVVSPSKINF